MSRIAPGPKHAEPLSRDRFAFCPFVCVGEERRSRFGKWGFLCRVRIEKQLKMGFCLARRTKSGTKTTRLLILQQVRDGTNDNAEQSVLARLLLTVLVLLLLYYYFDADACDVSFSRLFVLSSLQATLCASIIRTRTSPIFGRRSGSLNQQSRKIDCKGGLNGVAFVVSVIFRCCSHAAYSVSGLSNAELIR